MDGLSLDALTAGDADLSGSHILELQKAGLSFGSTQFTQLHGVGVLFQDASFEDLNPAIRFNGSFGPDLIEAGVQFKSNRDFNDFKSRGGTVLQQSQPPRGGARTSR